MAKREIPSKNRFVVAAIYAAVAVIFFITGLAGNDSGYFFSLVWTALTAVWVATGVQQRRLEEERARAAVPDPVIAAPASPSPAPLTRGEREAAELRRLGETIQNPTVRARTEHLEETTRKILAQIVLYPEKQPQARQFLAYYLPTSVKVLDAYSRMGTGSGLELQALRSRIEALLENLCAAFDKQLDALLRDEALDISTDITVMEQMLRQEGFGGTTMGG